MYLLALLLVSLLPAGAAVPLVTAGKPAAEVVVADGNAVAKFAATELVTLVERSTGARLPVVSAPTPDCAHVYLGAGEAATKAGVSVAGLAPEGFRLRTVGSELFIVGDDFGGDAAVLNRSVPTRAGTLSGVYELLERVAGVRFYWHDELGTIVPKRTDLTVPDLDVTQAPHWLYRSLPYSPEGQTSKLFGRRLRLGQAYGISHGHNWYRILPAEKYGQEHPEYFAEIKGERQARYYSGHHGGQVCTSNPAVVEVFARHIIEYFDATPAASMYSVSPNDGGGFCECANCRALDLESWGDEHPGQPVMTDRILTFYNAVAERVAAKHPDKYLGAYIYSYYRKPPVKTRPHPNLALVFAINSIGTHGEEWTREKAWIDAWTALTNNFYLYDIMWLNDWSLGLPAPVTRHAVDKLQHLGGTSMRGGYLYAAPSYESLGPLHYLTAKLMWDPKADVAALESGYYADLYGPAAGEVKAWYDLLESRVRKMRLEGLDTTDPALIRLASGTQRDVAIMLAAYQPILAQADGLLDQAEARELTTEQRQRLARLRDHHDLLRTTVVAYLGAEHLTRLATWDPDEVKRTQEAIDERAKLLEKLRSYAPTLVDILVEQDKSITAPITPAAAAYQLARRAGPSVVTALPAAAPPKIDGEIDKPWQTAAWRDL
ncbi:MAG: DUF4838 domain-containing protein, partial [Armatimonadetes bacterium]|nr:DUF4838 domain-containing protein [Armatimonadota bacterium]